MQTWPTHAMYCQVEMVYLKFMTGSGNLMLTLEEDTVSAGDET